MIACVVEGQVRVTCGHIARLDLVTSSKGTTASHPSASSSSTAAASAAHGSSSHGPVPAHGSGAGAGVAPALSLALERSSDKFSRPGLTSASVSPSHNLTTTSHSFTVGVIGPGQWFGEKPLIAGRARQYPSGVIFPQSRGFGSVLSENVAPCSI